MVTPEKETRSARRYRRKYDRLAFLEQLEQGSARAFVRDHGPDLPRMMGEHVCFPGCGLCLCVFRCPLCAGELVKRGSVKRCLYRVECADASCGWFSSPLGDLVRMPELDLSDPTSKLAQHCREFWAEVTGS